ncbi:hypothetical protein AMELA_G00051380 [Ameiurus melas]|uniref:Uncharacterized protein n=1 Tax=Ameiurus melas TaxID=219545 RepID=A0A7J6B5L3_AMEME|nr:hypothetical protein AMELA_G00051380 [Ameiurus melas]
MLCLVCPQRAITALPLPWRQCPLWVRRAGEVALDLRHIFFPVDLLTDPASDRRHSVLGLPQTSQLLKREDVVVSVGSLVCVCVCKRKPMLAARGLNSSFLFQEEPNM